MATGWVKSLQCKSRAYEDVLHPNPKHLNHLLPSSSCRKSVQNVKDVIETSKQRRPRKPKPQSSPKQPDSRHTRPDKSEPNSNPPSASHRVRLSTSSTRRVRTADSSSFFPSLSELPEGHPSRNVVEIIFHTSWSPKSFMGRVEVVFKVQNSPRTVARFEEYREVVKSRAADGDGTWEDDARCVADGNEMMRFYCLGPTTGRVYDAGGLCGFPGRKGTAVCTYSGSGDAHESGGSGMGRRAMLVCRVIAGRVSKRLGLDSFLEGRVGFDSVSGDSGELIVFDFRAVLPCFLIIYKL
ncbi:hypothetical protein RJ641_001076 [Dillenia turbinata]|uniref:PARP catalytic domain-containing protein n=1 Tax=Dillenia turbinata TaxID=194707 RepID=A0AAN8W7J2_9MAGN